MIKIVDMEEETLEVVVKGDKEISDYSKPTWTQQVTYISNMHPSLCMLEYKMVRQKSVFTKRLGQCQERKQERTRLFDESPQKSR